MNTHTDKTVKTISEINRWLLVVVVVIIAKTNKTINL